MWFWRRRRTLDVSPRQDPRNADYPVSLRPDAQVFSRRWKCHTRLNQGREGACVAFALSHWMATEPAPIIKTKNKDAFELYERIKRNDRAAGEDYSGTWIEDGLLLLKKEGLISEFRWAKSADEMALTLSNIGPLICKVPIYNSFYYPVFNGELKPNGSFKGWHAMEADEIDQKKKRVWFTNSWGRDWGLNGRCWMSFETVNKCLDAGGTAAVAFKQTAQ